MGSSFRRPPTAEPPIAPQKDDSVDYIPAGQDALGSVKRIAQAIPYRKIQRKAEAGQEEKAGEEKEGEEKAGEEKEGEEKAGEEKEGEKYAGAEEAGEAKAGEEKGEAKEEAPPIAAKLQGVGRKIFLADDGKLTAGGRRKLGNLVDMQTMTVTDAIKARGGGAGQARMAGPWAQKTLCETANAAAAGDETAETAIKMVKQASSKAGDHSGRSG